MATVRIHGAPPPWRRPLLAGIAAIGVTLVILAAIPWHFAAMPEDHEVVRREAIAAPAYDLWGRRVEAQEARTWSEPPLGAVAIDEALLRQGRAAFYTEDHGNELFFTDLLGLIAGPLRPWSVLQATLAARAEGTTNLRVALATDTTIEGVRYPQNTVIDTGLDLAPGSLLPLGVVVRFSGIRPRVGVACALCHSSVDPETKQVIHGAANSDLNAGLLLALASNSAALFTRTGLHDPQAVAPGGPDFVDSAGHVTSLPDPGALEDAVDRVLLAWPPGYFDATSDLVANPTRIPNTFTFASAPFGWSGNGFAGPFRGLATFTHQLHGISPDALLQVDQSAALFGLDPELYLATLLQGASRSWLRFRPGQGLAATTRLALLDSMDDAASWRLALAISAWLDTLIPPEVAVDDEAAARGREVFTRAGCQSCHSGPAFTDHRVIPARKIGSEPSRARAFARTREEWSDRAPRGPSPTLSAEDLAQQRLALGHDGVGGYKVPSLIGLWWSAPYLHDGGVAVGVGEHLVGVEDTRGRGIPVDPRSSLRGLLDRELRRRIIAANRADRRRWDLHIRGVGHEFWVDPGAGFSPAEQRALIEYLLSLRPTYSGREPVVH